MNQDPLDAIWLQALERHQAGDLTAAIGLYDRIIAVGGQGSALFANRGVALLGLWRLDDAVADFDRALALRPDLPAAHANRGVALHASGCFEDALAEYEAAIALAPEWAEAHENWALTTLLLGRFEAGWRALEWRKRTAKRNGVRPGLAPDWTGAQALENRRLFVHAEQGLGDTIQFSRLLPTLQARGAQLVFSCQNRLHPLMRDAFPDLALVDEHEWGSDCDYSVALMSLPLALGLSEADLPHPPYLRAKPDRIATWRSRLGPQGFKVGVVWKGSARGADQRQDFEPAWLKDLADLPGVRLISLQMGADIPQDLAIETLSFPLDEEGAFLDTAAIMENLDLVITADTAAAHLAGAMGRPVWVALKRVPDWRWLLDRQDSPWYPSMSLFRQRRLADWSDVFAAMRTELAARLAPDWRAPQTGPD